MAEFRLGGRALWPESSTPVNECETSFPPCKRMHFPTCHYPQHVPRSWVNCLRRLLSKRRFAGGVGEKQPEEKNLLHDDGVRVIFGLIWVVVTRCLRHGRICPEYSFRVLCFPQVSASYWCTCLSSSSYIFFQRAWLSCPSVSSPHVNVLTCAGSLLPCNDFCWVTSHSKG